MAEQTIKSRLQFKTDTPENWAKATGFVPKKGEPIIYQEGKEVIQLKIGDGETAVEELKNVIPDLPVYDGTYREIYSGEVEDVV